ncbi:12992_t:CDS:1 [Funneliformis mosseae]|uniref:12992_t:CDS:1 n=1 Tax=Funneliformis mosseae TaxID=27381 RepID=A0A9N8VZ78_FUNMO|nr:12992_t:CDS:1 [Funneliformis mosseae]
MQHIKTNTAFVALARQNARNLFGAKSSTVFGHHGGLSNRGKFHGNGSNRSGQQQNSQHNGTSNSSWIGDNQHHKRQNGISNGINSIRNVRGGATSSNFIRNNNVSTRYRENKRFNSTVASTSTTNNFNVAGMGGENESSIWQLKNQEHLLSINELNNSMRELNRKGFLSESERHFRFIKQSGITPNIFTYNLLFDTIAKAKSNHYSSEKMIDYYNDMLENNVVPNLDTYSIVIKGLCKIDIELTGIMIRQENRFKRENNSADENTIQQFIRQKEKSVNFALDLFEKTKYLPNVYYDVDICDTLLRSLANHGRIDDGLAVFEYMETNDIISTSTFGYLISLYSHGGDMQNALECFNEFRRVGQNLRYQREPLSVYNQLISAYMRCNDIPRAIEVLQVTIPEAGLVADEWSYHYFIRDLCDRGELDIAYEWFLKCKNDESLPDPILFTHEILLLNFSNNGDYEKATEIYQGMKEKGLPPKYSERASYFYLTLQKDPDRTFELLDDMIEMGSSTDINLTNKILEHFDQTGQIDKGCQALLKIMNASDNYYNNNLWRPINPKSQPDHMEKYIAWLRDPRLSLKDTISAKYNLWSLKKKRIESVELEKYDILKKEGNLIPQLKELEPIHIHYLFETSISNYHHVDNKNQDILRSRIFEIANDVIQSGNSIPYNTLSRVSYEFKELSDLESLEKWKGLLSTSFENEKEITSPTAGREPTIKEFNRSADLSNLCKTNVFDTDHFMKEFHKMLNEDLLPTPELVSQAIRNLGKAKELEKALEVYNLTYDFHQKWKSPIRENTLHYARNSMLVAYATSHNLEGANKMYQEIIDSGRYPDANAIADYLVCEGERNTDEATTALKFYNEIKRRGFRATTYFYNVLISKLGKARKYDAVWEIFEEMKRLKIQRNVVTYGALIAACVRVKSEEKALSVFREMERLEKYQLRIGPFNSMIQFYTWDLHNREKALEFFEEIRKHKLNPSEHTFKLLIDAYATIEPYDMHSAMNVFNIMKQDGVIPQSTHFASLIYSYGVCQGDVQNALQIFNSMQTVHNIRPDENAYQAIFDALIANKRIEEAEEYYDEMLMRDDVKSTPYIENLFIRGYGQLGQWDRAETVFNNMIDLNDTSDRIGVPREPSTYEEMVKAYVISGQIEKARELASILERKDFPEIVKNNIANLLY